MNHFLYKTFLTSTLVMALLDSVVVSAQPIVDKPLRDAVQFIPYDESMATRINAKRGFATHVKLEKDERITEVAGGDSAGWGIVATKGGNDVFIKPKSTAHDTNLLVSTDKRSYVFDLRILNDRVAEIGTWKLAFTYPSSVVEAVPLSEAQLAAQQKSELNRMQSLPQPKKNIQYSMQVMKNSNEIAPTEAWDDGTFTYLRIPGHREIPAVFRVLADGSESMVNTHMEGEGKDTIVIHGVAKRYVLRSGKQVIGIWNDDYDIEGVNPKHGTVTSGVSRKVLE